MQFFNVPSFPGQRASTLTSLQGILWCTLLLWSCTAGLASSLVWADDGLRSGKGDQFLLPVSALTPENKLAERLVEDVAIEARQAVVVISVAGRNGAREGLGSGVIIHPQGLVATNLHVIGEARPISVELSGGRSLPVESILATDQLRDLAILKVAATDLPFLPLADDREVRDGQAVVAIGNPLGLERSVVSGVLSGRREIEGRTMMQVAVPIERGNSGGPLLDRSGRVVGLLTLKSLQTQNLGFAVPSTALLPLVENPNPVPLKRWLTIGVLDANEWVPLGDADWSQRAGRVRVAGVGTGFGGRGLCLSQADLPPLPYELSVKVRYDEKEGAAGLAFCSDGRDKHYGFYLTNGGMRLTRFDGPDVFSWKILADIRPPRLDTDGWIDLKVRIDAEQIVCYLNGDQVTQTNDRTYRDGKAGLCKFRTTTAEFRSFRAGAYSNDVEANRVATQRVRDAAGKVFAGDQRERDWIAEIAGQEAIEPDLEAMLTYAKELEQQAARLKKIATRTHVRQVQKQLAELLKGNEADSVDLCRAALLISRLDNSELDIEAYMRQVGRLSEQFRASIGREATGAEKLVSLDKLLFSELGFHGSRNDYDNRANSYLNEVLDDREGLPLTLGILYIELARREGVKVAGIGLPGHFVVKHLSAEDGHLIDVFEKGKRINLTDAIRMAVNNSEGPWSDDYLIPMSPEAILQRMLRNLISSARRERDTERLWRYVDTQLLLNPSSVEDHYYRAALALEDRDWDAARDDVDWLKKNGAGLIDPRAIDELEGVVNRRR